MSERFSERLHGELSDWVEKKLVTKAASEKIFEYAVLKEASQEEGTVSKLVPFLSIIGSAFVGVGFILYFAANWNTMSDLFKFGLLVVATATVSLAAYVCLFVRDNPKTGHALALLASILYGASIFLIGQTYNLWGTFSGAMLLWIAGVVPIAYVTALPAYAFLLSILFFTWIIGETENAGYVSERLFVWLPIVFGFFLSGIARWHSGIFGSFSKTFSRIGIFFVFSGLFLFTFKDSLDTVDASSYVAKLFFAIGAAGVLAYAADLVRKKRFSPAEDGVAALAGGVTALLAILLSSGKFDHPLALTIFANLFFVGFAIASIAAGVSRRSAFLVNTSLLFVSVFIFAKYFDWFFDMMDRALFFIFWGALLVFWGWFVEMRRRKIVTSISKSV